MIDLNPIWYAVYLGLTIGAPVVFFYFLKRKKEEDRNRSDSFIENKIQKLRMEEVAFSNENLIKVEKEVVHLKTLLSQKEAIIKEKEAEFLKIKPLLKYLREPPSQSPS